VKISFYKYEGTGNDFIIIDNRERPRPPKGATKVKAPSGVWGKLDPKNYKLWKKLCDRRFGIGADGLMLLQNKKGYDFEMYYVNADGKPTSMCGNGGRCITHFAKSIGAIKGNKVRFLSIDGPHEATINGDIVKLKMKDVDEVKVETEVKKLGNGKDSAEHYIVDTGSPHYVSFVKDVMKTDVYEEGKSIRNSVAFKKEGINVNFVQFSKTPVLRTYERGVEDETLSCGTGTVAAALVLAAKGKATAKDHCDIKTMGGNLRVWFTKNSGQKSEVRSQNKVRFKDVYLEGPATFVFKGEVEA